MRTVFVVLLLLGGWLHGYAQKATDLLPVKVNGKWGYINKQGATVITPQYDAAGYFDLQLRARVVKNGRVKHISYKDGVLQELETGHVGRYDDLRAIGTDLVAFRINDKWGLADWLGNIKIPCRYDAIDKHTHNNRDLIYLTLNHKLGVADADGNMITDTLYLEVLPGTKAMAVKLTHGWGLIGYDGEHITECKFASLIERDSNYWRINSSGGGKVFSLVTKRVLTIHKDADFTPVSGYPQYLYITSNEGLGILSADGREIIKPEFDYIKITAEYFYVYREGKMGIYHFSGTKICDPEYDQIENFDNHVALVRTDNTWGLINDKGKQVVPPIYNQVNVHGNTAKCQLGKDKVDVYELTGTGDLKGIAEYENVINIMSYSYAPRIRNFNSSQVSFIYTERGWYFDRWKRNWGYRDSNFVEQIPPAYRRVMDFPHLKMALVERALPEASNFRLGEAVFKTDARYGIISTETYTFIYPPIFNYIDIEPMMSKDFKYTRGMMGDGKFVPLTRDGYRTRTKYTYIGKQVNGRSRYTIKGNFYRIRKINRSKVQNPYGTMEELMKEITIHFAGTTDFWWRNNNLLHPTITMLEGSHNKLEDLLEIREGEWGYLGEDGMPLIKPEYTMAFDFFGSTAIAVKGTNYGIIDSIGTEKIPFEYKRIDYLANSDSLLYEISVYDPNYGVIDSVGNVVVPILYSRVWDVQNNMVRYRDREKGYGYVGIGGAVIEGINFRTATDFLGEYACVKIGKRWNLMDQQGYLTKELEYSNVGEYSEGLLAVFTHKKYGYANADGEVVIPAHYKKANPFKQGAAVVSKNGRTYGYILPSGKWLAKPKFKGAEDFNEAGYAIVRGRRGYGMIDKTGNMLLKPIYKSIEFGDDGMITVQRGNNSFIYNIATDVLQPLGTIKAEAFKNGYAIYSKYGKYGIIDTAGKVVVEAKYSECTNVTEGIFAARDVGELYIMSLEGDTIYSCEYHRFFGDFNEGKLLVYHADSGYRYLSVNGENAFNRCFENAEPFSKGTARVFYENNWGLINQDGLGLVDAKYSIIKEFKNGYAIVGVYYTKGVATNKGELLFEPDYEQVNYINQGVFRVEKGNGVGYISEVGKWIWGLQQ